MNMYFGNVTSVANQSPHMSSVTMLVQMTVPPCELPHLCDIVFHVRLSSQENREHQPVR